MSAGMQERGIYMINRTSWKIIELVLRRYPESKIEYEQYIVDIMASSSPHPLTIFQEENNGEYSKPQSVTEAKALKMTSKRAERLKKEIEAVELVYNSLKPEEQKIMKARFWSDRCRNLPYTNIDKVAYSERQMRRIVKKIILQVGIYLGEI